MTNLIRWEPFTDLRTSMDRMFDEGFARPRRFVMKGGYTGSYTGSFPVEISETEEAVEIKAALPGAKPDEVDISVANDVLTIKAEHKEEVEDKKREYYRREMHYGAWHRSFSLPVSVDADRAEAKFDNGMLYLKLPKAEALRPKQIKVTGSDGHTTVEGHGTTDGQAIGDTH